MTDKVRIGFVGVGDMGQMAHLKNYVTNDDCEVVAIAELRRRTGEAVARRYGVASVYQQAGEMIEDERLDAIVAVQHFTRHGVMLSELLDAGKPIFMEKPLAASVQTGERIVEMVQRSGTFVMVGYHKRSDPATVYAKRLTDELTRTGELGRLTYIRILFPSTQDWVANGFDGRIGVDDPVPQLERDPPAEDLTPEQRDRWNDLVSCYIHQINLTRHLLGEPFEPVYADRAGLLMVGRSQSGKTTTLEMSPYETTIDFQEEAMICFQHGWIRLTLPAPLTVNRAGTVEVYRDPGGGRAPTRQSPTMPGIHAMKQQAAHFIAAVRGEQTVLASAAEALEDMRVARSYLELTRAYIS